MIATFESPALLSVAVHQRNVPAMTRSFAAVISRGESCLCLPPLGHLEGPPVLSRDIRANHKTYLHGET